MKVFIFEDSLFDLENIKIILEELGHTVCGHSSDSKNAMAKIKQNNPDVVLIDIRLRGHLSGVELSYDIKNQLNIPFIFISAQKDNETVEEAIRQHPITYLTKPVKSNDLKAALLLIKNQDQKNFTPKPELKQDYYFIKDRKKLYKIKLEDVIYIHADSRNYSTVVLKGDKKFTIRSSLKKLMNQMKYDQLMQVHRGYVVNKLFIDYFDDFEQVIKVDDVSIPIGKTFKKDLKEKIRIL